MFEKLSQAANRFDLDVIPRPIAATLARAATTGTTVVRAFTEDALGNDSFKGRLSANERNAALVVAAATAAQFTPAGPLALLLTPSAWRGLFERGPEHNEAVRLQVTAVLTTVATLAFGPWGLLGLVPKAVADGCDMMRSRTQARPQPAPRSAATAPPPLPRPTLTPEPEPVAAAPLEQTLAATTAPDPAVGPLAARTKKLESCLSLLSFGGDLKKEKIPEILTSPRVVAELSLLEVDHVELLRAVEKVIGGELEQLARMELLQTAKRL